MMKIEVQLYEMEKGDRNKINNCTKKKIKN